ncbi:MAG: MaoC family dehydratase [Alphaproteobacteria bacterium]|nr:MaoC family dehydratase [Alphaproteobacteria bacterium]
MAELYFEDFKVGDRFVTPGKTLTEKEIIDFARVYDPQEFHLDPVAAKQTIYGGLIASGFQTLAFGFRLVYDTGILTAASMGSPGFDELRWLKPVRPGDTLHVEMEVTESRPSQSKPDRGIMRAAYRYLNQKGEAVLTYTAMHLLKRKPA